MASVSEEDASRTDNEEDAAIDLSLLRELGKNTLINALNSVSGFDNFYGILFNYPPQVNGSKTLVLDPTIAGPLGLLTEVSLLKVSLSFSTLLLPTEHDTCSNMA